MKKILLLILFALPLPSFSAESNTSTDSKTYIYTTEEVPGGNCTCVTYSADGGSGELPAGYVETSGLTKNPDGTYTVPDGSTIRENCGNPSTRKYQCTVPKGLEGFQNIFAKIIRAIVNIVLLLGVLAVVGLGIAWSFAGGEDVKMKSSLKAWAFNVVIGLTILFLFRYILEFLAPWIYQ